jgi:hypothetical protein
MSDEGKIRYDAIRCRHCHLETISGSGCGCSGCNTYQEHLSSLTVDVWKKLTEAINMASGAMALYFLVRPQGDGAVSLATKRIPIPPEHPAFIILCISVISASLVNVIAFRRINVLSETAAAKAV